MDNREFNVLTPKQIKQISGHLRLGSPACNKTPCANRTPCGSRSNSSAFPLFKSPAHRLSLNKLLPKSSPNKKSNSTPNSTKTLKGDSPITQTRHKIKTKTYDRFIPNRASTAELSSHFHLSNKNQTEQTALISSQSLAYQQEIAKACGIALNKRILAFNATPPKPNKPFFVKPYTANTLLHKTGSKRRKIPTQPERVLDAPGLKDDYYLNLLDWSSSNLLAIALDQSVYLWNADTGDVSEFCSTLDESSYISSVQFAQDGTFLAIGKNAGETEIWDVNTSTKLRTLRGDTNRVSVLSWDKHTVSAGARSGNISNHDVRIAQHKTSVFNAHNLEVCGLKWRPDGQLLASGGNDNTVNIWDVRSNVPIVTKTDHTAAVKAIAWCPWQLNLLSTGGGASDKKVHFWNTTTTQKTASIDTGSQVTSIIWSREYKELITSHGYPNNHLSVWSYPSLNKITDLEGHDARILHSAISPDGQTVATTASDENLKFWKVFETGKKSKTEDVDGNELVDATRRLAIR